MKPGRSVRIARVSWGAGGAALLLLAGCGAPSDSTSEAPPPSSSAEQRCAAFALSALSEASVERLTFTRNEWLAAGVTVETRWGPVNSLPAHCVVEGYFGEREGLIGGPYRIGFRMRLPENWNGRFFFQGGGGSNGYVRDAIGEAGGGNELALARGYAVIAQDSGHDNALNNVPDHQGDMVFGFDPVARRNYGYASLKQTYDLGRHLLRVFYGRDSKTNIFWGCSKGGQEGMAFAQRYPEAFDGIVAMAPGMSLPRAALAQAWGVQSYADIAVANGEKPSVDGLKSAITPAQMHIVEDAVLVACDGEDGVMDGMVGAVGRCTTDRVAPELRKHQCEEAQGEDCLDGAQIDALIRAMDGPHNSEGAPLYAAFPWDIGVGTPSWSAWTLGVKGGPPSRNVTLGAGSLAAVFTTPPTPLPIDPDTLFDWQLAFDFDRDAQKIYAVAPPFETSAWQDVGMRSSDLSSFRAHGGKLIVPQGVSDPVFSVLDTIDWWRSVDEASDGKAGDFVRVFPVPGMAHCRGGLSTDLFDSLTALERWVDDGEAPDSILAKAGDDMPWPGRTRPLCPYPKMATYDGNGDVELGASFLCR